MKIGRTLYSKIIILISTTCLIVCCGILLVEEITFKGKVILSDAQTYGHGGVKVQVGEISTFTRSDGSFEIKANYLRSQMISVSFEKEGYKDTTIFVTISWPNDSVINLGTIILKKKVFEFFDNFNDGNADGWIEDDKAIYRVENGEYSIESPDDGYQHWALREFAPLNNNFLLQAKAKYVAGRRNEPFGIFVLDTTDICTYLFITKDSYYAVKWYNRQTGWHNIKDWTFSSVIDTISGRWNTLEIEKTRTSLKISINNTFLGSFLANSIGSVRYVGLYVQGNLHIHFDDVRAESR